MSKEKAVADLQKLARTARFLSMDVPGGHGGKTSYTVNCLLAWLRGNPESQVVYVAQVDSINWAREYFTTQHPDLLPRIRFEAAQPILLTNDMIIREPRPPGTSIDWLFEFYKRWWKGKR